MGDRDDYTSDDNKRRREESFVETFAKSRKTTSTPDKGTDTDGMEQLMNMMKNVISSNKKKANEMDDMKWEIIEQRGVTGKLLDAVKSIYLCTQNIIRTNNICSKEFITMWGVRQGGVLSPLLFISLMDEIAKNCRRKIKGCNVGIRNLQQI